MGLPASSGVYFGRVTHTRLRPFRHRLDYRVFSVFVDLDELSLLSKKVRPFSHNRWNLFSLHDRDHGPRDGSPLKPWIVAQLREAGIEIGDGRIRLLCFPRVLGYVFNPLSVWYCYGQSGQLVALLYEVSNTFGEHHSYLIATSENRRTAAIRQRCAKRFYVSPFIEMAATYTFTLRPPDERLSLTIREDVESGPLLVASHVAERRPFDDGTLYRAAITHPLVTIKVIAGIHWEAFKMVLKGAQLVRRPAPPDEPVTFPAGRDDPVRAAAE